jgi:outer membrane protein OmpA-like peptidoglycan-associated protein
MGSNINTFGDEKFPSTDSAGNFYFSSDGYKGYGGMDICVAKYNNGSYDHAAVLKAPFNSAGDDYGITFKKTGKVGYFSSNRNSGNGDEDIYYFNMDKDNLPCQVATSEYVIGYRCVPKHELAVKDTITHYVLHNATSSTAAAVTPIIHFDFDKYAIRPDAAHVLDSIASLMKKNSQMVIDLNGYCDSRGTVPYNETLSVHRSEAAENYLVSKGINRSRMKPRGYGKTHFVNKCVENVPCTDNEQEQNRRVEMPFTNSKKAIVSSDN